MSKLSLTLHTFSITGSVAGLFLIHRLHPVIGIKFVLQALEKPKLYYKNINIPSITHLQENLEKVRSSKGSYYPKYPMVYCSLVEQ